MKKMTIGFFAGLCLLTACGPKHNDTEQVIPPADSSGSARSMGANNEQMTRTPENAGGPLSDTGRVQDSFNADR